MNTYEKALHYRAKCLTKFANYHSELCDESGIAFWPIPVIMPLIFSKCITLLQYEITKKYFQSENVLAGTLTKIRNLLSKLAIEGDLGEDHVSPYIVDHPCLPVSLDDSYFLSYYQRILEQNDPFKILGFLYSIEVGSLEFVKALVETGLVKKSGLFAKIHLGVEVEHHDLAVSIREIVMDETFSNKYRSSFVFGCELHDVIYNNIANS